MSFSSSAWMAVLPAAIDRDFLAGVAVDVDLAIDRVASRMERYRRSACRCALMIANRNKVVARQLIKAKGLEAQALVDRYWGAISDVTSELDRRRHLTGRQAAKIIRQPLLRLFGDLSGPTA
jgi:hypothetical protein